MENFSGLYRDSSKQKNPEATWQEAKNILMTKQFNSPLNENGTRFSHKAKGKLRGIIESNRHIVYFTVQNRGSLSFPNLVSVISLYDINKNTITEVLEGNFNFNRPIEGVYKYDYKNDLIVVWCDGAFADSNTMKIAKLTNIDLPLIGKRLEDSKLKLIELFPNINKGVVKAETTKGNLEGLYAFVTFKYCYKETETVFKNVNTYCNITELLEESSSFVNKGIKLTFRDLDYEVYDSIKVGLHIIGKESNNSYISRKIDIYSSDREVVISNLNNFTLISNEELLIPKDFFIKGETITEHKDSILIGKPEKSPEFKFQKYANLLKLEPVMKGKPEGTTYDPNNINYAPVTLFDRFLQFNEVYAFYTQLELTNGETTKWFHVPNIHSSPGMANPIENSGQYDEYFLYASRISNEDGWKNFHIFSNGTNNKFGVWEDEQRYPIDDEYNSTVDYDGSPLGGVDLRDSPLKYHRIKEDTRDNIREPMQGSLVVNGATITNFSSIPLKVRKQIKNIRLGIAKRNFGNSLITSSGVMVPVMSLPFELDAEDKDNAAKRDIDNIMSTPFGDRSPLLDRKLRTFNRAMYLSPEIEKFKPSLDFNLTIVKDFRIRRLSDFTALADSAIAGNGKDYNTLMKRNRFYFKIFNYNYKLPNNAAQGVSFLDGGLYINYDKNYKAYRKLNSQVQQAFLPYTENNATGVPPHIDPKTFNHLNDISGMAFADVDLVSLKKTLYSLNEDSIIASKNTIPLVNNTILTNSVFEIGDVAYSMVKGSIKYKATQSSTGFTVYFYPIEYKVISPMDNSRLEIAKLKNEYNKDGFYLGGLMWGGSGGLKEAADVDILNSLQYGYEVKGSEKSTQTNNLAAFESFNINDNYIERFPYRVIRSIITPNEGYVINALRTFLVTNYYELQNNLGDIIALRSNGEYLFIQLRHGLLFAVVKDVLSVENLEAYLQTGDIFDRPPKPLTLDPKGFIGCEHKFACKISKEGYFTIDSKNGRVILASPEISVISDVGIRNWLSNNLGYENVYTEEVSGILQSIDDPYSNLGYAVAFDYKYNRIIVNKLYPEVNGKDIEALPYFKKLLNVGAVNFRNIIKIPNPKSISLSYSLDNRFWLCEHNLFANAYITIDDDIFGLKNTNLDSIDWVAIHKLNIGNKGEYFGIKYPSYIDLIFNKEFKTIKTYDFIEFLTEFRNILEKAKDVSTQINYKTLSKLIVYNDFQCSGEIILDLENFDITRNVEGKWRVNSFRDIVINPNLPLFIEGGKLNVNNLDYSKEWFDKSYFISNFIVVRCIWNNDTNEDIYLNSLNVGSRISKR